MASRLAILVDGDNIGARHSTAILDIAAKRGIPTVVRVYANAQHPSEWHEACGFRMIHAGTGKNASDVLLAIDAMELALSGGVDTFVIASSDGDFTHLAQRLREYGATVTGVGESKAPKGLRGACTTFEVIEPVQSVKLVPMPAPKVSNLDQQIRAVIAANSNKGAGMRIAALNSTMRSNHGTQISSFPERTWRAYLAARPSLYDLDPRGPHAMVRFRPKGFLTAV